MFYRVYIGEEEEPHRKEYRLTDSFADKENVCLECTATVLNVNVGHNWEILEQCRLLFEYVYFLEAVRIYARDPGKTKAEAIDAAVNLCIKEGILADFLTKHRSEVVNVLLTEYDFDAHMEATYEEGRMDGKAEGLVEGRKEGLVEGRKEGLAKGQKKGKRKGRKEGKAEEQLYGIKTLISINKKHCISREDTRRDLMNAYSLDMKAANKYLDLHWGQN